MEVVQSRISLTQFVSIEESQKFGLLSCKVGRTQQVPIYFRCSVLQPPDGANFLAMTTEIDVDTEHRTFVNFKRIQQVLLSTKF